MFSEEVYKFVLVFRNSWLSKLSTFFHILSCDSFQSKPCEYYDVVRFKFSKQWSKSSCGMFCHTLLLEIYQFGNLFDIFDGSNFKHFSFPGSKVCRNILLILPPDHFIVLTLTRYVLEQISIFFVQSFGSFWWITFRHRHAPINSSSVTFWRCN